MFLLGELSRFPLFFRESSHGFAQLRIAEVDADLRSQHPSQCWGPPDPQVAYGLGYGTCGQSGQGPWGPWGHYVGASCWDLLRMFLITVLFCSRFVYDKCCTVTRTVGRHNLQTCAWPKSIGSLHMTADPVACRTWGTSWNDSKAIRGPAFLAAWFPEMPDKPRYSFEIKRERQRESERASKDRIYHWRRYKSVDIYT